MSGLEPPPPEGCALEEGVVILDLRNGQVFFSDGRMEEILGLNPGTFAGVAYRQLVDPDQLAEFANQLEEDGGEGVFRYRHGNGRDWVCVRTRFLRNGECMHMCVRDATMTCAEHTLASVTKTISSWAPKAEERGA